MRLVTYFVVKIEICFTGAIINYTKLRRSLHLNAVKTGLSLIDIYVLAKRTF